MPTGNGEPGKATPEWCSQCHSRNYILFIYYKDVILLPSSYNIFTYEATFLIMQVVQVVVSALMLTINKQNVMNKEIIQSLKPTKGE